MIIVNARFLTQSMTGVQRFAVEICLELKKLMGKQIKIVAPDAMVQKDYAEALGVEIIGTHQGHLWEQWDLPCYLKKQGSPLLLCLCNTAPLGYKNKIVTVHDVAFKVYPQTFNKSFLYVYRFMIPRIMKSAIKVITVSEFSKTEITKYYDIEPNKIEVVYNAVSKDFKKVSSPNFRERKYLLAVSSLNYRKNFISVLKAFDIFEKTNSETDLYIIGDLKNKNFKDIDIERYQSNPRIKFLGRVTDEELIYHYSIASGFIYPSLYEGFGIPPLEAQTCGCAVLAANIPPLREVLGESALYCNPYDVYDIANGMKIIIEQASNYRVLGSENSKRFSWKESAEKIAKTCEL